MRCHICDRPLQNDEIKHDPKYGRGNFDPCGTCLEVSDNLFEPPSEEEIDQQLAFDLYYEGLIQDNEEAFEESS